MSSSTPKYTLSEHTSGIGIDLTGTSVRLLHLSISNGAFRINAATVINALQEGILDGQELSEAMEKWLGDRNLTSVQACATLPPMTTTESIFDLPPALPAVEIGKMVAVQARALENISDDAFIHDYQLIRVSKEVRQPVIMEIVKESSVNQQYKLLSEHHANIRQMTSHGLAGVNALLTLHPTASATAGLQLLLNIEPDYSTLSILRGGHLMGQSWLSFCTAPHDSASSPQALKDDITAALERWHETSKDNGNSGIPHTLWLTGEGAMHHQYRDFLAKSFPWMEIRILGVPDTFLEATDIATDTSQEGLHPELIVAFGLAVQAINTSPLTISLIPELARWQQERLKSFPLLVVSVACVFFGMLSLYLGVSFRMKTMEAKIISENNMLKRCQELVPKLDKARKQLDFHQKQMLPIVEAGHRTNRYLEVLQIWDKALEGDNSSQRQNWGIFLADEGSFNFVNTEHTPKNERNKTTPYEPEFDLTTRSQMNDALAMESPHQPLPQLQPSAVPFKQKLTPVTEIPFLKNIYIGGITPLGESRYKVVKEIQTRLMETNIYTNVDDHIDFLIKSFSDRYFMPWLDFLRENKQALGNDYTIFFLQLPFKDNYINQEMLLSPPVPERKNKKKR